MRFALIDAEKAEFPVRTMCRLLDVSESGFFAWQGRPASQRQRDDMIYLAHIRTAFELSNRTYGSPRMHRELVDEGLPIGRRRTARLMRENGLAARQKRRFKRTTDSTHAWPVVPNLLDQDFAAEAPDQKWSADISYIWTAEGWLYLAVLVDLFSRRVVGWAVSDRLKKDLALRALRMARLSLPAVWIVMSQAPWAVEDGELAVVIFVDLDLGLDSGVGACPRGSARPGACQPRCCADGTLLLDRSARPAPAQGTKAVPCSSGAPAKRALCSGRKTSIMLVMPASLSWGSASAEHALLG